jgi:hypothetical protein
MYRFTPRGDFAAERAAVGWAWHDGPPPGSTWTLCEFTARSMRILGVGGVFDAGGGLLHAWAVLGDLTRREWAQAGRLAAHALDGVERFQRPRRISATARTAIPGATMVLGKLGFEARGQVYDERIGAHIIYQVMVREAA